MTAVRSDEMDGGGDPPIQVNPAPNLNGAPPPFLSKTYEMVDDAETDAVISWGPQSNSFVVWDQSELSRVLLPKYFKHSNFSSFVRQLNTYGFKKVDPDKWEFANEGFLRGQKHLLKNINRRKPSQAQHPQAQNAPAASCVEVGKFGVEEEIERLKRDKNVLMQELIKLRQHQQESDNQLQILGNRLQGMENHQKLTMSFLAKAMQSPGLFGQLVQQNENNRHIDGLNKKRRFLRQDQQSASPDGQIIKYQPTDNFSMPEMQDMGMLSDIPLEDFVDEDPKLLDIMDSLLEEFVGGEAEVDSSFEAKSGGGWENGRNMDSLAAQMGLLASETIG